MAETANENGLTIRKFKPKIVSETGLAQTYSLSDFKSEEMTRLTIKVPLESARVLKAAAVLQGATVSDVCWESLAHMVDELADEYNIENRV